MSVFWPDKVARQIARLFADDPDGWSGGTYEVTHAPSGTVIWIANAAYALEVRIKGAARLYGFFFPIGNASQLWIWWAFKRWQQTAALRALLKAKGASA